MFKKITFLISFLLLIFLTATNALAQNGTIRGTVIDDEYGDALIGANIVVEDAAAGGITDLDGKFEISVPEGTYKIRVSYVSFANTIVEGVVVKEGEVTPMGTIRMKEDNATLGEVVVAAKVVRNTEAALITVKRKAPNLLDGISAATFEKIGDSDAAGAMSRVTGVSVEGGKYIYVRGLGDRYTKTTLNGVDIPGLDPDRNTIQMDLFPTNVIDNIVVAKSFTANLPADFTGGAVDIATKDFPDEKIMGFSIGLDYNPSMHFNQNFVKYDGSRTDNLGFDNGQRALPTGGSTDIPQYANVVGNPNGDLGQEYQNILRSFDPTLGGYRSTSFMDMSMSYSFANQRQLKNEKWKLGYNAAITYKNEREYYEDAEFNLYAKDNQPANYELIALEQQSGDFGVNKVLVGGLASVAIKSLNSKVKLNVLHIQNGESKAGIFYFENSNLGANFEANQYNLEYTQRTLTNILLNGTHKWQDGKWEFDWKFAPTRSAIEDPDIRFTRFRLPTNTIGTEVGLPERIWRFLEEYNFASKADFTREYKFRAQSAKVLFGAAHTYKMREYNIQNFQFSLGGSSSLTGDPNEIFTDQNYFSAENRNGLRYSPQFIPINPNEFQSSVNYAGAYVSNEMNLTQQLKTIIGVRLEKYDQFYTGTNQTGTIALDNERVIDDLNLFPTLNLVYNLNTEQNVRASFTRTIARPSMKEMSFAEILDPITGRTFIGGMLTETTNGGTEVLWDGNLRSTNINNFDLRWEFFKKNGNNISLSAFYKTLKNPIEIVQFLADPGSFQPRNVGDAQIIGGEIEFKKNLSFISASLEKLAFNANFTYTQSSIQISETEKRSRTSAARDGEVIADRRTMAGQAPWILNTGLAYNDKDKNMEAGIFYNVQGPTLMFVGFGNRANVYSVPFHSLNVNVSKNFGKEDRMSLGIKASNLLNDWKEQIFSSYQAQDQYFQRLRPGTSIGLKFGFKF